MNWRKYNRRSHNRKRIAVGMWFLLITFFLTLYGQSKTTPLISPYAEPVYASNPTYSISCDNPKGYLECQVYKKVITWEQHDLLNRIIKCESNWNPNAINTRNKNGTYDRGLFQSNSIHKDLSNEDAFNYKKNIDWGIQLFKKQGTTPWNSSKKCWK
jgi:hypothetical protein